MINFSGGFKGGKSVMVEPHRHEGVFIGRGKEDVLCTRNLVPGDSVYGEKRISVEVIITLCIMLWLHDENTYMSVRVYFIRILFFKVFIYICMYFIFCNYSYFFMISKQDKSLWQIRI